MADRRIIKSITLPGEADTIVLWEATPNHLNARNDHNLVRMNARGGIVWAAQLPQVGSDSFVSVQMDNGKLLANSWSCFQVTLDIDTGRILTSVFTK